MMQFLLTLGAVLAVATLSPAGVADVRAEARPRSAPRVESALQLAGPRPSRRGAAVVALGWLVRGAPRPTTVKTLPAFAPYRRIELVVVKGRRAGNRHYLLLLSLPRGWFAALLGTRGWQRMKVFPRRDRSGLGGSRGGFINRRRYYEVPSLHRIDVVRGGPPEIVLRYANPKGGFREQAPEAEQVQVCGLGPSKTPSCTHYLFVTTPARRRVRSLGALFGPRGEIYALAGEGFERQRIAFH